MTLAKFSLRIESPDYGEPRSETHALLIRNMQLSVLGKLGGLLSEAEENISDLLPEGYYCKIEED